MVIRQLQAYFPRELKELILAIGAGRNGVSAARLGYAGDFLTGKRFLTQLA